MQLYTEPNKYAQKPNLILENDWVQFEGYQKFQIAKYDIAVNKDDVGLQNKKAIFDKYINSKWLLGKSVLDLGCNSAFFCYYSRLKGAYKANGVEIDKDYIKNVRKANEYLDIENVGIEDVNVMDYNSPADLVFAFALIHWIYSCTSDYGSLDLAIKKLADLTNEVLIIEWIDKEDDAIQFFKHINYNQEIIKEKYNRQNFEKALNKHFVNFELIGDVKPTRKVYIAYKSITTMQNLNSSKIEKPEEVLTSLFVDLLNDNTLNQKINLPQKSSIGLNNKSKPNTPSKTNYVILSNWELIAENKDVHFNNTLEVLIDEISFITLANKLKNHETILTFDCYQTQNKFQCLFKLSNKTIKIVLFNADSEILPKSLIDSLLSNTKLLSSLKIPNFNDYIFYLFFKSIYIIGAGENAIKSEILKYSKLLNLEINHIGLEKYNLNNLGFLHEILKNEECELLDYNSLLETYSIKYIYPPHTVLNSRVLDSSTGRYFISRIYLTKNYNKDFDVNNTHDNFIITKQANNNLATKEYGLLSSINSDYFPKVSNFKILEDSTSFDMEFVEAEELDLLINNNNLSLFSTIYISYHLIQAVKYLFSKNIEHRDINPSNILFDGNKLKIIDFGWAKLLDENSYTPINLNSKFSSYHLTHKHNDFYSILKIIDLLIEIFINNNTKFDDLMMPFNDIRLEVKSLLSLFNSASYQFNVSSLSNLENLLLIELSNLEKEQKIINNDKNILSLEGEIYNLYKSAYLAYKSNNLNEAYDFINSALTINPENEDIFDLYLQITNALTQNKTIKANQIINEIGNQSTFKTENISSKSSIFENNQNQQIEISQKYYDVSIIIPIFNKIEYTVNCLNYLYQNTSNKYSWEVIIVDNGSTDNSKNIILDTFNKGRNKLYSNLTYISNEYNMGFAKACNKGIKNRNGKDVILLNNDTLPLPNWFEALVEEVRSDKSIGVAGSCLLYPNTDFIQHCGVRIGTEDGKTIAPYHIKSFEVLSHSDYAQKSKYVTAVTGAVMYITSETIDKIGLFDELYINGLEDIDYCFKTKTAGFKIKYVSDSILYHYESISDDRHKYDIQNWQRLNRNWLGKIEFDENVYETTLEVNSIKNRQSELSEYDLNLMKEMPFNNFEMDYNKSSNKVLSIIIPVHNNKEFTQICLESIWGNTKNIDEIEIIIIDNDSDINTKEYLNSIKDRIILITNTNNETYSKVNNQGAKLATGKYILCLNNDIKIISPSWIEELITHFEQNPNTAIQGAKLLYENEKIQHCGIVWGNVGLDFPLHYHIYLTLDRNEDCVNKTLKFQFVTGAFLAIRKETFDLVGGFDEKYIFGHEDLDLCMKVSQIGGDVVYNHKIEAIHFESRTKQLIGLDKFERFISSKNTYDLENHRYFLSKWNNELILDADKYFIEDGFWGLVSDIQYRKEFENKVVNLLDKFNNKDLITDKFIYTSVCKLIFKSDSLPNNFDVKALFALSIFEINKALELISQNENNSIIKDTTYQLEGNNIQQINENVFEDSNLNINSFDTTINYRPLTILITMYGWEESGGGTLLPKHLAIELAKSGNKVYVLYATGKHKYISTPYYIETKIDQNVNIIGIYNRSSIFLNSDNPELDIEDKNIIEIFSKLLYEIKPDIIHYNNFLGLSLSINDIAKKFNIKTIYSPHNYYMIDPNLYMINSDLNKWSNTNFFENSELPNQYLNKIKEYAKRQTKVKQTLKDIDYILATSRKVGHLLSEITGNKDNIYLVNHLPNLKEKFLNQNHFTTSNNNIVKFAYIGGVMPHKGVHNIFIALKNVSFKYELHIFGFVIEHYKRYLDSLSNVINVIYHNEYHQSDIPHILSNIDCVLVTSIWEDCAPLVLAESLSQNVPIIGAEIGGIPDFVIDEFNGLLYQYNDIKDLKDKLEYFVSNYDLRQKLKSNSKLTYNFNYYVNHLIKLYQHIANNKALNRNEIELKFRQESKDRTIWEDTISNSNLSIINTNFQTISDTNIEKINNSEIIKTELNIQNQESIMNANHIYNTNVEAMNRVKLEKDLVHGFANNDASGSMPNPLPSPLKLNLGCGKDFKPDFVNLDLFSDNPNVVKMDIRNIELPDNSVDYILASDVLEHFSHRETDKILREWSRVLKPNGEIEIRCPNLKLQLQAYMRGDWNADIASYMIFGGQTNPGDYHCIGFDEISIKSHLALAGFEVTHYEDLDYPQTNGYINLNMIVKARKLVSDNNPDYIPVSNSFTKLEPEIGTTYGNNDNLNNFDNENDDTNFAHINLENVKIENKVYNPKLNVVWEGTQFVYHSLALVNREQCLNLIKSEQVNLTIVPYETNSFDPTQNERYHHLIANDIRYKAETPINVASLPYVWIRHQWPPKNEVPLGAKWILMQPWEFTTLRKDFIDTFQSADEIWTPSNYSRQSFINSGIDSDKIQVIPNGINPNIFTPIGDKFNLKTIKKLKFLFLGGTIPRKGIDILLQTYLTTFTANDNVCLVIKDMGGDSFYRGQTAKSLIEQAFSNPQAPEIEYIDSKLTEEEIATLYRSCDVFVSPYRGEGFSLPTLEAMACGLPVIVTKGGATDDYVDESIGWQIPSDLMSIGTHIDGHDLVDEAFLLEPNEDSLKQILMEIYKNPSNLRVLGLKASHRARKYWTWDKSTLKILSRLDSLYSLDLSSEANQHFSHTYDLPIKLADADYNLSEGNHEMAEKLILEVLEEFDNNQTLKLQNLQLFQYATQLLTLIYIDFIEDEEIFQRTLDKLNELKSIDSNNIDTLFLSSILMTISGQITEALETLTKCIELWNTNRFESNISLTLDLLLCNSGDLLSAMGDYETAIQVFTSALDINSENEKVYFGLGLCYKQLNIIQEARNNFGKALEFNPNFIEAKEELTAI